MYKLNIPNQYKTKKKNSVPKPVQAVSVVRDELLEATTESESDDEARILLGKMPKSHSRSRSRSRSRSKPKPKPKPSVSSVSKVVKQKKQGKKQHHGHGTVRGDQVFNAVSKRWVKRSGGLGKAIEECNKIHRASTAAPARKATPSKPAPKSQVAGSVSSVEVIDLLSADEEDDADAELDEYEDDFLVKDDRMAEYKGLSALMKLAGKDTLRNDQFLAAQGQLNNKGQLKAKGQAIRKSLRNALLETIKQVRKLHRDKNPADAQRVWTLFDLNTAMNLNQIKRNADLKGQLVQFIQAQKESSGRVNVDSWVTQLAPLARYPNI